MKVGSFRRYSKEDYKELPPWGEQFFVQLNKVLETHNNALNGGLTLSDNQNAEVRKLDLTHDTTTPVKLQKLTRNPDIAWFGGSTNYDYPDFTWELSPDTPLTVNVKVKWATDPGKVIPCVIVFERS